MNNSEKCLLVAGELRERAKLHGTLSRRARMLILAERLESAAGRNVDAERDFAQLSLSAYGHRLGAGNGASA